MKSCVKQRKRGKMRIPKTGEIYRHFKNKLYQIVAIAEHTEDGQKLVIYQALYGTYKVYARPLEMFISEVDHEKYPEIEQKYRFEKVEFAEETPACAKTAENEMVDNAEDAEEVKAETEELQIDADEPVGLDAEEGDAGNGLEEERVSSDTEVIEEESDEIQPEVGLLEFLDEEDWDKKYNILVSLRDKMNDRLVDNLAVALDVVIPDGPVDKRYEQLKICVRTRQKYENQHLR